METARRNRWRNILVVILVFAWRSSFAQRTAMGFVSHKTGWAVFDNRFVTTSDSGRTWTDSTPAESTGLFSTAVLTTETSGWAVTSTIDADRTVTGVNILTTSDAGKTWRGVSAPKMTREDAADLSGTSFVSFVDNRWGWVLLKDMSSSNFSKGNLFMTADGGNSWVLLPPPPIADKIRFTSASSGWLAGGPGGDELYRTADGGRTWSRGGPNLDFPTTESTTVGVPVFTDALHGTLSVVIASRPDNTSKTLGFTTADGGTTWNASSSGSSNSGGPLVTLSSGRDAVAAYVDASGNVVTRSGTSLRTFLMPANKGSRSRVEEAAFADDTTGALLVSTSSCPNGKSTCHTEKRLLITLDGGYSYAEASLARKASTGNWSNANDASNGSRI